MNNTQAELTAFVLVPLLGFFLYHVCKMWKEGNDLDKRLDEIDRKRQEARSKTFPQVCEICKGHTVVSKQPNGMYLCQSCVTRHNLPPQPPAPRPQVEEIQGELIGWRGWRNETLDPSKLWSLHRPCIWDGPTLKADQTPAIENKSGIYCYLPKSVDIVALQDCNVVGEVSLNGIILVGQVGYRATQATIRTLYLALPQDWRDRLGRDQHSDYWPWPELSWLDVATKLEERYQCDVLPLIGKPYLPTETMPMTLMDKIQP